LSSRSNEKADFAPVSEKKDLLIPPLIRLEFSMDSSVEDETVKVSAVERQPANPVLAQQADRPEIPAFQIDRPDMQREFTFVSADGAEGQSTEQLLVPPKRNRRIGDGLGDRVGTVGNIAECTPLLRRAQFHIQSNPESSGDGKNEGVMSYLDNSQQHHAKDGSKDLKPKSDNLSEPKLVPSRIPRAHQK